MQALTSPSHGFFRPVARILALLALLSACGGAQGASSNGREHDVRYERTAGAGENTADRGRTAPLDSHARSAGHHAHTK
jgi:hypothetical protein